MPKLTDRVADAARAEARPLFVWDSDVPGFGIKVTPNGRKVFVFQYRLGGRSGTTKRVTLGAFPSAMTCGAARREAVRLRGDVAHGRSPSEQRASRKAQLRADRTAPTVADLADDFLRDRAAKKKPTTVTEYRRLLERDVLPTLGAVKVAALTRAQVARLHLAMQDRPYLANRALAILAAMLRFAELHEQRPRGSNPCTGIEPYPEQPRERFLSDAEFAALGSALARAEREGLPVPEKLRGRARGMSAARRAKLGTRPKRGPRTAAAAATGAEGAPTPAAPKLTPANPYAVAALRFLLLTGWRESEALSLRWDALDFERAVATLADTKTGRSVRHVGAPALALLAELPRLDGSPYVFPGAKRGAHLKEIKRVWEAVRHAAGLADVRLHDLRHSFASAGAGGGLSLPIIGALLGHREVATTQRYAHLGDDPRKRAADQVSAAVAAALHASATTAKVLPMTARG